MSHRLLAPLVPPLVPQDHGTKATHLASIAALGAAVPPGLILPVAAHAEALGSAAGAPPQVPAALAEALAAALPRLGAAPWVVRTSAPAEDLRDASAAGLFRSELGLLHPAAVVAAVERCWAAAWDERVVVYLAATGRDAAPRPRVAILIQPQVRAHWAGVLFTRDPRLGPETTQMLCELAPCSTTGVTAGLADPQVFSLDRAAVDATVLPAGAPVAARDLMVLAERAEAVIGGPADVELALTEAGPLVLQVRPITAYSPAGPGAGPGPRWRWDAEHNPEPLSPLHASLVARLDRRTDLPFRLCTVAGYLYTAPREDAPPNASASLDETPEQIRRAWPRRRARLEAEVVALEALAARGAPLTAMLEAFEEFYVGYATLAGAPLARSHRHWAARLDADLAAGALTAQGLDRALRGVTTPLTAALRELAHRARHPTLVAALAEGRDVSELPGGAALEADLAAVLARVGALPPAWDVAVPTLAETPALVRRTVAALARQQRPPGAAAPPQDAGRANLAADEEDDLLFARGLAALRRALLAVGHRLARQGALDQPDDVFHLSLEPLLDRLAAPDKEASLQRPLLAAPAVEPDTPRPGGTLVGFGSGGGVVQARALVVRRLTRGFTHLVDAARGRIVVCPALLPSAVVLLAHAAGVVTDHGGLLSHGAILARELGLPAVLGTRVATTRIATDDLLWLDATQGLVIRR